MKRFDSASNTASQSTILIAFSLFLVVISLLGFIIFSINNVFAQPGDSSPPIGSIAINNNQPSTSSNIVTLTLGCDDGDGFGCSTIVLIWDNIDANLSPQSIDSIPNIRITSSSDSVGDTLSAVETGPNTGIFILEISRADPIEPGDTGVYWEEGDTIIAQNMQLSSQDGTKIVSAEFEDYAGNRSSASDTILLGSDSPDCTISSPEHLDFSVTNVSVSTLPGVAASANLVFKAPSDNSDAISTRIFIERSESSPNYSINANDFFIFPGETRDVAVLFNVPAGLAPGNYAYQSSILARDVHDCSVSTLPVSIILSVFPAPDFTLSSTTGSFNIARGGSATSSITVDARENSFAPLVMNFQAGWNYHEPRLQPIQTNSSFNTASVILEPGDTIRREMLLEPTLVDDSSPVNYIGDFAYTIIATGVWTDANGANQTITRRLDLPVSITEETFDFALSADNTMLFLEKGKTSSIELNVKHLSGRRLPVTLSAIVAPIALEAKLENQVGTPDFSSRLDVKALSAFSPRELEVVATGGGKSHSIKILLTNIPFAIDLEPSSSVSAGGSMDEEVSIVPLVPRYNSTVFLSISSSQLPEDTAAVSLVNDQGMPPFSTLLGIRTTPDVAIGNYTVVVTATDNQFTTSAIQIISISQTGSIIPRVQIDLSPRLDSLSIDGSSLLASDQLIVAPAWQVGEEHQLSALSEVLINETTKFVFDGWSDGENSPTRTILVSELATTIVGNYRLQYYLGIESAFGEVTGSDWYDEGRMASFSIDKTVPAGFAVNQIHEGWSGQSADLVGQLCQGETDTADAVDGSIAAGSDPSKAYGTICMNAAHTLVANWKSDSSLRDVVIGGGLAAAAIGGVVAFLAKTGSLNNLIKGKRPKIPILSWEVYSPAFVIVHEGTVFVDITLKNMGEADAKNIKIEAFSEDLVCPPAHLIENLMPWESRKISLVARPRESRPSYSMKVTLKSKYLPKKELMAVVAGTEIRYVPKKEESLSFPTKKIKVGVYGSGGVNAKWHDLPGRLLERGFALENMGGRESPHVLPSFEQMQAGQYDVILLSSATELLGADDISSLQKFVTSGKGLVMFGAAVSDKSNATTPTRLSTGLLDLFGCKAMVPAADNYNKQLFIEFDRCLGVRISESDHPVTRGFLGGEVFKTWGGAGAVMSLLPVSDGKVLAEQWLQTKDNQARNALSLPAVIAAATSATTTTTTIEPTQETEGRTVLLNIDSRLNITLELVERSILWASRAINDKSHSQY